jgi:hypothetical protein
MIKSVQVMFDDGQDFKELVIIVKVKKVIDASDFV